ncbi:hypothetical protein BaRGS_00022431 [Batillaria attramentaria]|uniref:UDP-glucuronate decarboxylase n=1 Tax=Batillaria attramentaria TaxID=370345 RepID=A0ABD0KH31_9CAEN
MYGDGSQTRTFQYVSDVVEGLVRLMNSDYVLPVNMAGPDRHTIMDFAKIIQRLVGGTTSIVTKPARQDDPKQRQPDISRAVRYLGWQHKVPLEEGIKRTIKYYRSELQKPPTPVPREVTAPHSTRFRQKPPRLNSPNRVSPGEVSGFAVLCACYTVRPACRLHTRSLLVLCVCVGELSSPCDTRSVFRVSLRVAQWWRFETETGSRPGRQDESRD